MQFYERIRELREDNDVKQETMANLLGVGQSYYSKQEQGSFCSFTTKTTENRGLHRRSPRNPRRGQAVCGLLTFQTTTNKFAGI